MLTIDDVTLFLARERPGSTVWKVAELTASWATVRRYAARHPRLAWQLLVLRFNTESLNQRAAESLYAMSMLLPTLVEIPAGPAEPICTVTAEGRSRLKTAGI